MFWGCPAAVAAQMEACGATVKAEECGGRDGPAPRLPTSITTQIRPPPLATASACTTAACPPPRGRSTPPPPAPVSDISAEGKVHAFSSGSYERHLRHDSPTRQRPCACAARPPQIFSGERKMKDLASKYSECNSANHGGDLGTKSGGQELVGGLDCTVHCNFFGSQLQSFETELLVPKLAEKERGNETCRGVFIRAPAILEVGSDVEILADCPVPMLRLVPMPQYQQMHALELAPGLSIALFWMMLKLWRMQLLHIQSWGGGHP